jgi:hypothetical protein
MSLQAPNAVAITCPPQVYPNPETRADTTFQSEKTGPSRTTLAALATAQIARIEASAKLLLSIPTIQATDGSVRYMLARIHLSRR